MRQTERKIIFLATKTLDILFNILKWATVIFLVFMVVITFTEVVRRYIFGASWAWSEELIRYMIIYCTFLGGAAAFRVGSLVCFDLVLNKLTPKVKIVFEILDNTALMVLMVYFFVKSVETMFRPSIAKQVSASLHFSVFWVYLAIPVGLGAMIIFAIENYFKLARRRKMEIADPLEASNDIEGEPV